jgi:hypothetical protein
MNHQSNVSLLSHPMMLQRVSAPLQRSIRFFRYPKPTHTFGSSCDELSHNWGRYRISTFPTRRCAVSGACSRPRSVLTTNKINTKFYSYSFTFWFEHVSRFCSSQITVFNADSFCFHPRQLSSTHPALRLLGGLPLTI